MIDIQEKKKKVISFLENSGPSLPVRIAKAIEMDPIFTSAILSELLSSKDVKTSNMRVGASPLYFLEGQEQKLEEQIENLKSAEKEAFLKLKKKKILKDEEENPQTRVALRNIRDFAIPFRFKEKIMWRHAFTEEKEIREMLENNGGAPEKKIEETKEIATKNDNEEREAETKETEKNAEEEKPKKIEEIFTPEEDETEFFTEIKNFLDKKGIEFTEKIQTDKKEIVAKVSLPTKLGDITFLLIAKNKKSINISEINSSIQRANYEKMPCLLIIRKEPSKKIQNLIEQNNLIKLETLE
jgi:hypothetical protein